MIIDISDILINTGRTKQYTVCLEDKEFSYRLGTFDVIETPEFEIEISSPDKNKLHIRGKGYVSLSIPCGRCLKECDTRIDLDIDEEVSIGNADDEDEEEQCFVESHFLDVNRMLYNEIILNMPGRVLCDDACKGICTVCGRNLNDGECGCDRFVPDPRMSVFADVFDKFSKNS